MENRKVLLSIKDLHVKFRVRGRILTAIRGVSLDLYENESIAIVGESGSGKSVLTKTFAGMLDTNGFIDQGSIIYNDEELSDIYVALSEPAKRAIAAVHGMLNKYSKLELGASIKREMIQMESDKKARQSLSAEETSALTDKINELTFQRTELFNMRQTIDTKVEKERYKAVGAQIKEMDAQIKSLQKQKDETIAAHKAAVKNDTAYLAEFDKKMAALKADYAKAIAGTITKETEERNLQLAKEMYLSVGSYPVKKRFEFLRKLLAGMKQAMIIGADLTNDNVLSQLFDDVVFRVKLLDETAEKLHGKRVLNLAKVTYAKDWTKIRGTRIATVFQDPMTSLNPIITIGKQITSVILKHQNCSELEARQRALEIM